MSKDLLNKIEEARAKFLDPIDQKIIGSWEAEAKRAFMVNSLKDHKGIQIILENFGKDVAEIDELLKTAKSKDLNDIERDRLIDRKGLYLHFMKFFDEAEKKIGRLEEEIENQVPSES